MAPVAADSVSHLGPRNPWASGFKSDCWSFISPNPPFSPTYFLSFITTPWWKKAKNTLIKNKVNYFSKVGVIMFSICSSKKKNFNFFPVCVSAMQKFHYKFQLKPSNPSNFGAKLVIISAIENKWTQVTQREIYASSQPWQRCCRRLYALRLNKWYCYAV